MGAQDNILSKRLFPLFLKESMEKLGCTSQWDETNLEDICLNEESIKNSYQISLKTWNYNGSCLYPCSFIMPPLLMTTSTQQQYTDDTSTLELKFSEKVQIFESVRTYSTLSLIAEIGGYVGLFLGVSIYQLTGVVDFIFIRWTQH